MQITLKNKVISVTLLALLLCGFTWAFCTNAAVTFYDSDDEAAYKKAQSDLDEINAKQKALATELAEVTADKKSAMKSKQIIEQQISNTEDEISTLEWVLNDLNTRLDKKASELTESEVKYNDYLEKYKARIRATYEAGTTTYLEVILTSSNFSELLTRIDLVSDMMEYDKSLLDGLRESITFINNTKTEMEEERAKQEESLQQLTSAKVVLEGKKSDLAATVSALAANQEELEEAESESLRLEAELNAQINELLDKQKKYVGGDFMWPLDYSHTTITSGYGYRNFDKSFHDAIDIAAPKGSPIYAANSGTIIMYQWVNTGGGNKVVIDHGSKVSTTYCHLSAFVEGLGVGSYVEKGQVIGYVGMTGTATGNHLHFRIAINGTAVNPLDYVTADGSAPDKTIEW